MEPSAHGAPGAEPEADLARRAAGGDRSAFGELYRRLAPAVHGVLLAHVGAAEAKDLLQDVFVRALGKISALDDPARVGPWLCAIARNRARDHHRARSPEIAEAVHEPPDPGAGPSGSAEAEEILLALHSLPEAYRETLSLRLVEGLGGPEIARRTGLTSGSVRVNLCRGMKLLRERLQAEGWS
jgi:RNA polymerase sigma-70 factor (ECF subfamily)